MCVCFKINYIKLIFSPYEYGRVQMFIKPAISIKYVFVFSIGQMDTNVNNINDILANKACSFY